LQYHFNAFEQKGLNFCPGNFTVNIKPESANGKLKFSLNAEMNNADIRYTSDNSQPNVSSSKYAGPVSVDASMVVKAAIISNGKVMGYKPAEQTFTMHKGVGREIKYVSPFSKYYPADGPNTLTDGVRGTSVHGKNWHGFNGKDLEATVDLGAETEINNLALGCVQNYRSWIFFPQSVKFELSIDGQNFTEIKTVNNTISANDKTIQTHDFSVQFPAIKARYVRVVAKNLGVCPEGHSGAGQAAWLFADELIIQ
jgi:hexosaminidase